MQIISGLSVAEDQPQLKWPLAKASNFRLMMGWVSVLPKANITSACNFSDRVCHGSASSCRQTGDGGSMSETSTMIDIVGPKTALVNLFTDNFLHYTTGGVKTAREREPYFSLIPANFWATSSIASSQVAWTNSPSFLIKGAVKRSG